MGTGELYGCGGIHPEEEAREATDGATDRLSFCAGSIGIGESSVRLTSVDLASVRTRLVRGAILGLLAASTSAIWLVVVPGSLARAADVTVQKDIPFGTADGQDLLLDAYLPSGGGTHPAVILIHSGGWAAGDKSQFAQIGPAFAQAGLAAFAITYRLAPQSHWPAPFQDCQTAVEWVRQHASQYGVDPRRIGALGTSAGGELAGLLGTSGSGPPDQGFRVKAVVTWSGPFDLTHPPTQTGNGGALTRYFGFRYDANPQVYREASPLYQVDPSDAPMYIFNSAHELVALDQATSMAAKLQDEGVPHQISIYPEGQHAEHDADKALAPTIRFFQQYLSSNAPTRTTPTSGAVTGGSPGNGNGDAAGRDGGSGSSGKTLLVGIGVVVVIALIMGVLLIGRRPQTPKQ
jgi:acetyl esterase